MVFIKKMKTNLALFTICLICMGDATSTRSADLSLDPTSTVLLESSPPHKEPLKPAKVPYAKKPKVSAEQFDNIASHYPEYPDFDDDIAYTTYFSVDGDDKDIDDVDENDIGYAFADDTRYTDIDDDWTPEKYLHYPETYENGQVGDFTDNEKTDLEPLELGASHNIELDPVKVYDFDDEELEHAVSADDIDDGSHNPAAPHVFKEHKFLTETASEARLAGFARDDDEIPDFDDREDDHNDGNTLYLLVTSFEDQKKHSGKVWVVDEDNNDDGWTLIAGLDRPEAVCFDINHEFLYVADTGYGKDGHIYQYEIDYDDDGDPDSFELRKKTYAIVYKGTPANSCSVDEYGNLFFSTVNDMIHIVSYLDLWSGFTNQHTTLYDGSNGKISGIQGLDVRESEDIYYVNSKNTNTIGILNKADAKASHLNSGDIDVRVMSNEAAHGIACSDYLCYFITDNQVFAYDVDDDSLRLKTTGLKQARGITWGDDTLWIADHKTNEIYKIEADNDAEEWMERWLMIPGAYGVYAINSAALVAMMMLLTMW